VDALYAKSVRVVHLGGLTSQPMVVELGLAQGDTLSCILSNLYANDLIAAFEQACAGVELPLPTAVHLQVPGGDAGCQLQVG
jgi:hypothetical protein